MYCSSYIDKQYAFFNKVKKNYFTTSKKLLLFVPPFRIIALCHTTKCIKAVYFLSIFFPQHSSLPLSFSSAITKITVIGLKCTSMSSDCKSGLRIIGLLTSLPLIQGKKKAYITRSVRFERAVPVDDHIRTVHEKHALTSEDTPQQVWYRACCCNLFCLWDTQTTPRTKKEK